MKSIHACCFARDLQQQIGEVQSVNQQRNATLLLEGRSDAQIAKIQSLKCIAGPQVKVEVHPTLNLCKGVVTHEDFASESEEDLKSFFEPKVWLTFTGYAGKSMVILFHRLLLF